MTKVCEVSGAVIETQERIYYANVLSHKNIGDCPFMHPTLHNTRDEALNYTSREFFIIKTIEVKI